MLPTMDFQKSAARYGTKATCQRSACNRISPQYASFFFRIAIPAHSLINHRVFGLLLTLALSNLHSRRLVFISLLIRLIITIPIYFIVIDMMIDIQSSMHKMSARIVIFGCVKINHGHSTMHSLVQSKERRFYMIVVILAVCVCRRFRIQYR